MLSCKDKKEVLAARIYNAEKAVGITSKEKPRS